MCTRPQSQEKWRSTGALRCLLLDLRKAHLANDKTTRTKKCKTFVFLLTFIVLSNGLAHAMYVGTLARQYKKASSSAPISISSVIL